jgi:hypothetical protein
MGNDVANSFHSVDFQAPDFAYVPMDNGWFEDGLWD